MDFKKVDKLIHEPARLGIISYLFDRQEIEVLTLKVKLGFSWGNLSVHLHKLEKAGYIKINKIFKKNKPVTLVKLRKTGIERYRKYRRVIKKMIK